jgi:hypothetical protein
MKNLLWLILGFLIAVVLIFAVQGWSYTYDGNPGDAYGGRDFATYGMDVAPGGVSLYTNWYQVWIPQDPVEDSYWAKPYADLFIYTPSGLQGVPLIDHNGLTAGSRYQVTGYQEARGYPNWMLAGSLVSSSIGLVTVSPLSGSPDWLVYVPFLTDPGWGYLWTTSECANSVVEGHPTPEPSTFLLLAVAMVGIMIWLRPVSNIP